MLFELSFSETTSRVSVRELKNDIVEGANISRKGPQVSDRIESVAASPAASLHVTCRDDLASNKDFQNACISCFAGIHRTNGCRQIVELSLMPAQKPDAMSRPPKPSCPRAQIPVSIYEKSAWKRL